MNVHPRFLVPVVIAVSLLAPAVVLYGRREGRSATLEMQQQLVQIRAAVGGRLSQPSSIMEDASAGITCLLYGTKLQPDVLELCFSTNGLLIEGLDRRVNPNLLPSLRWNRDAGLMIISRRGLGAIVKRYTATFGSTS